MKKIYIETYGCRLNLCESEVILALMKEEGYEYTSKIKEANLIILNSCSVRDVADKKIYERLTKLYPLKQENPFLIIGIVGCFVPNLSKEFLDEADIVSFIAGPNTYRKLPQLVRKAEQQKKSVCLENITYEMYHDIRPLRHFEGQTTGAIIIMKGCNQECSYCIEPFTRGAEQSRDPFSILDEAQALVKEGFREITLVGHVIDKYHWVDPDNQITWKFADILEAVAKNCPTMRVKFLSSHPAHFSNDVLQVMADCDNIMRVVHLPVQSGSDKVLDRMLRGYTKEQFLKRISEVRSAMPDITIISDIIVGFCLEDENDFEQTKEILRTCCFDDINAFAFSLRTPSPAAELYEDNVDESVKLQRLNDVKEIQKEVSLVKLQKRVGQVTKVIVEAYNNSSTPKWRGRNNYHQSVIFSSDMPVSINDSVDVLITEADSKVLYGETIIN